MAAKHWTEGLEPFELYGEKIDYASVLRKPGSNLKNKGYHELIPEFPWENENHGLGSPLMQLLEKPK